MVAQFRFIVVRAQDGINERFRAKMKAPVPAELILVVVSTIIVHFAGLVDLYRVAVIGRIPTGLPSPRIPSFAGNFFGYVVDGIVLAVVAFAISISMAKMMAEKYRSVSIYDLRCFVDHS